MRRLRVRLTYSNVMATIAVFVALGGSSYAALRVGSKQIADNSVRSRDVRNNNLTGKDVKARSLTASDIKRRSLTASLFKAGQLPAATLGGSALVARPRGSTTVPAVSNTTTVNLALSNNSWVQPAGTHDAVYVQVDIGSFPCTGAPTIRSVLRLYIDGVRVRYLTSDDGQALPSGPSRYLAMTAVASPDAEARRTLTATFEAQCTNGPVPVTLRADVVQTR